MEEDQAPKWSVLQKIKSIRGIVGLIAVLITWIGCILAWAGGVHLNSLWNYWVVTVAFVPIVNFAGYLYSGQTLFVYSFATMFYTIPVLILGTKETLVTAGLALAFIGAFLSFVTYPNIDLQSMVSLKEFDVMIPSGVILLFSVIGFVCLATFAGANALADTAAVQLVMTVTLFFTAVLFNLQHELYIVLASVAHMIASSLAPALNEATIVATPVARAGGVFSWFASLGILVVTILRLNSMRQESENASVDRVKDKIATWRGIAAGACVLIAFIGAICFWASQPMPFSSWMATLAFASVISAFLGYLLSSSTLYALAFSWLIISFSNLVESARAGESGPAGIAGAVFLIIAMYVAFCTFPAMNHFDNDITLVHKIGVLAAGVCTFIGAITLDAGHTNYGEELFFGSISARLSTTCLFFVFAIYMKTPDFYSAAFFIGLIIPMSMFGLMRTTATGTAGAVFLWFAAIIMAVIYYLKVRSSGIVDKNAAEREYKPILGQDGTVAYPPASSYPAVTTSYPAPVGEPTTDPSVASSGPFGTPPPAANTTASFAPHPDDTV